MAKRTRLCTLLGEALALAEPGGFIRLFVDEGVPMARLLYEALAHGVEPAYYSSVVGSIPGCRTCANDSIASERP